MSTRKRTHLQPQEEEEGPTQPSSPKRHKPDPFVAAAMGQHQRAHRTRTHLVVPPSVRNYCRNWFLEETTGSDKSQPGFEVWLDRAAGVSNSPSHPAVRANLETRSKKDVNPMYHLSDLEMLALVFQLDLRILPDRPQSKTGVAAQEPRDHGIEWCTKTHSDAHRKMCWRLDQADPAWLRARGGSIGASQLDILCGWSDYGHNINEWRFFTGEIGKDAIPPKKCIFFDWGHWIEGVARSLYCVVMGSSCEEAGLLYHRDRPWKHASPDGMFHMPSGVRHHRNDPPREHGSTGLMEIKGPSFVQMSSGSRRSPHHLVAHYVPQLQDQLEVVASQPEVPPGTAEETHFVPFWRVNERRTRIPVFWLRSQGQTTLVKSEATRGPDDSAPQPVAWVMAHMLVTRSDRNPKYAKELYRHVDAWRTAVLDHVKPERVEHAKLGGAQVTLQPLKEVWWLLHHQPKCPCPPPGIRVDDPHVQVRTVRLLGNDIPHQWVPSEMPLLWPKGSRVHLSVWVQHFPDSKKTAHTMHQLHGR